MTKHWKTKALLGFFVPAVVVVTVLMLAVEVTLR